MSIDDILISLERGFTANDCKQSIRCLLDLWTQKIGPLLSPESHDHQAVTFESMIKLRLRGLGETPALLLGDDSPEARVAVTDLLNRTGSGRHLGLILCATESVFRWLRTSSTLPPGRCVVLSRDELRNLLANSESLNRLRELIRNQVPFLKLVPFSTSEPAQGLMFVGRQHELQTLLYENQDYALCGLGGMGKSSLLRQLRWTLRRNRDPRYHRLVEVDLVACPADLDAAARAIAKAVIPSRYAHEVTCNDLDGFLRRAKASDPRFQDGPIDLIIDEIDLLLSLDRQAWVGQGGHYPLMRSLRHARHVGSIRLTISGRDETRRMLADDASPFSINAISGAVGPRSRFKLMELTALHRPEAEDLLLAPLEALGCFAHRDRMVDALRRLNECDGVPFHIQNLGQDIANAVAAHARH